MTRIDKYDFEVRQAKPTPESEARWARRAEVLADWLLAEWQREREEAARARQAA